MATPEPLIVIVGQTASGKSALAMELAQKFKGELICADARTIYKGMDIGTAKPSAQDQATVPHHLLDVVTPGQLYSAADFKTAAQKAIVDIHNRGMIPILVGGTGLYVDAVLYDYDFRPRVSDEERAKWERLSVEELQDAVAEQGLSLPNNPQNPRHLMRVLETGGAVSERKPMRANTLVIGVEVDKIELPTRIESRIDNMLADGLEREVSELIKLYGQQAPGLNAIGYREWQGSDADHRELIIRNTKAFAKRQKTWFKRNKSIHWIRSAEQAVAIATTFMNKFTQ